MDRKMERSVYTYEAMKEIYLTEKARKEEEQRKHEEEKMNRLLVILEGYVIEAIKQGKSSCYLELDRLKDGKKPAIEESKIDLYIYIDYKKYFQIHLYKNL
jgi:hypothetical protein